MDANLTPTSFFSRVSAEEGKKLFLRLPTGETTESWILVQGQGSVAYSEAYAEYRMQSVELAAKCPPKGSPSEADRRELLVQFVAKLTKAWSFEIECTRSGVVELLAQAPLILDDADLFIHDRQRFFA